MIRNLCFVLLGFIVGICIHAASSQGLKLVDDPEIKAEVAIGQGRFQPSPSGMWRDPDQDLENASRYKDNGSSEIGFAWRLTEKYGMSARWVNLGHIKTSARVRTCPDGDSHCGDRSAVFREECAHKDVPNCVALWVGGGGIHGVNIAFNTELLRVGQVSLDGELGVFAYEMSWVETVLPLACKDHNACEWRRTDTQESGPYLSPMGSLTVRWNNFFIASRIYARTAEHTTISPGYSGYVQTWLFGGSFAMPKFGGTIPTLTLAMDSQPMGLSNSTTTWTVEMRLPL